MKKKFVAFFIAAASFLGFSISFAVTYGIFASGVLPLTAKEILNRIVLGRPYVFTLLIVALLAAVLGVVFCLRDRARSDSKEASCTLTTRFVLLSSVIIQLAVTCIDIYSPALYFRFAPIDNYIFPVFLAIAIVLAIATTMLGNRKGLQKPTSTRKAILISVGVWVLLSALEVAALFMIAK